MRNQKHKTNYISLTLFRFILSHSTAAHIFRQEIRQQAASFSLNECESHLTDTWRNLILHFSLFCKLSINDQLTTHTHTHTHCTTGLLLNWEQLQRQHMRWTTSLLPSWGERKRERESVSVCSNVPQNYILDLCWIKCKWRKLLWATRWLNLLFMCLRLDPDKTDCSSIFFPND